MENEKWRFDIGEPVDTTGYKVKARLGRGAAAEAYLVVNDQGEDVVLKIPALHNLKDGTNNDPKSIANINAELKKEAKIMKALADIQAVPRLMDNKPLNNGLFYIVTEYVNPDEYQNLISLRQKSLEEKIYLFLIEEILKFFARIHEKGYEYCDVKPDHFCWNRNNPERSLLVIDYNLSVVQKPAVKGERLRWVVSDLRRLGQVLFTSLLMGQEAVAEIPTASRPIPFEGDKPSDLFLPTSFKNASSGSYPRLDWFLRRLHAGKYGSADDALEEFKRLEDMDFDPKNITQSDKVYVENQVTEWSNNLPDWDTVENCWGRLGEPYLPSLEALSAEDELAVRVYLWGLALASSKKSKVIMVKSLQENSEINQKDLQSSETLMQFEDWRKAISDPAARKKRAWDAVIASFADGYEKALPSLESYYEQDQASFSGWVTYIETSRSALQIWTYGIEQPYRSLHKQCFELKPKEEDTLLCRVTDLYKKHIHKRKEILFSVLSFEKVDQKKIDDQLKDLQNIERDIFECIGKLLSPVKSAPIWPNAENIKLATNKLIVLVTPKDNKLEDAKDGLSDKVDEFIRLMGLGLVDEDQTIENYKKLFVVSLTRNLQSNLELQQKPDNKLENIRGELVAAKKDLEAKERELRTTKGELDIAKSAFKAKEQELFTKEKDLGATKRVLDVKEEKLRTTEEELKNTKEALTKKQDLDNKAKDENQPLTNKNLEPYSEIERSPNTITQTDTQELQQLQTNYSLAIESLKISTDIIKAIFLKNSHSGDSIWHKIQSRLKTQAKKLRLIVMKNASRT